MKIGILTYHRSHNYGALLQAVALRYFLSSLGHDVFFVDYWPEYHKRMYRIIDIQYIKEHSLVKSLKYLLRESLVLPIKIGRKQKFTKFISKNIDPYCKAESECFDCIIYGSDQIWRKQPGLSYQFNPIYFGEGNLLTNTHISYAASMGEATLEKEDGDKLNKWLSKFKAISVRESSLKKYLDSVGVSDVKLSIDPTLLLDKAEWERLAIEKIYGNNKKHYALFYDLMDGSFNKKTIREYANKRGLKLITITGSAKSCNYRKNIHAVLNPFEMINYISNAECVFTSSYHGLVFSLIFNKKVFASFRHNSSRAESLLDYVGLRDKILIEPMAGNIKDINIDYDKCNDSLRLMRRESMKWIRNTITSL